MNHDTILNGQGLEIHFSLLQRDAWQMNRNAIRWFFKKIFRLLPQKQNPSIEFLRERSKKPKGAMGSIIYLFSGTYGDFVQCLPSINLLAVRCHPNLIYIRAPNYVLDFKKFLPDNVRVFSGWKAILCFFRPVGQLFTNVISTYRTGDEMLAYFCAKKSYGFCYENEMGRPSYSMCFVLSPYKNYTWVNLALLEMPNGRMPTALFGNSEGAIEEGLAWDFSHPVYFHVGSRGLKIDLGFTKYSGIVVSVLKIMNRNNITPVILVGPGDDDVKEFVSHEAPDLQIQSGSISEVSSWVESSVNPILCFNSFMAHLCYHLNRAAVVIHNESVPIGYDCGDRHHQILLKKELNYSLKNLEMLFEPQGKPCP